MTPSPWQASQRPPLTLKLNRPGIVAARACFGHLRKQFAQRREQSGVGRGIRARRATDGTLVDVDDAIDVFQASDLFNLGWLETSQPQVQ